MWMDVYPSVCLCECEASHASLIYSHLIFPLWDSIYHYMHWLNHTVRTLINAIY